MDDMFDQHETPTGDAGRSVGLYLTGAIVAADTATRLRTWLLNRKTEAQVKWGHSTGDQRGPRPRRHTARPRPRPQPSRTQRDARPGQRRSRRQLQRFELGSAACRTARTTPRPT